MSKTAQILGAALMTLWLTGCGQKGPLYLPTAQVPAPTTISAT